MHPVSDDPLPTAAASCAPITVILADPRAMVRAAIKAALDVVPDARVLAEADSSEDLRAILDLVRPDVVVTDLFMQDPRGPAALRNVLVRQPSLRVVPASRFTTPDVVQRAVAEGVDRQVVTQAWAHDLGQALRCVCGSASLLSRAVTREGPEPVAPAPEREARLSGLEVEILTLLARGLSSRKIGRELQLSTKAVATHRRRIKACLGVRNVAGLTLQAVRQGLVNP